MESQVFCGAIVRNTSRVCLNGSESVDLSTDFWTGDLTPRPPGIFQTFKSKCTPQWRLRSDHGGAAGLVAAWWVGDLADRQLRCSHDGAWMQSAQRRAATLKNC